MSADEAPKVEDVDTTEGEESPERTDGKRVLRVPLEALVWVGLVAVSIGLLAGLFYFVHRPDTQTNDAAQQAVKDAAKDGVVAVYTYSADTLDRDIASAQSHLTGDFLSEYKQYAQSLEPFQTKMNAVKTAATVVGAAVIELHPGSADVLLFINQTTTNAQNPATALASRSIRVSLLKVDGKWLISSLKPV